MTKVKFIITLGFVLTFFVGQSQNLHSAKVMGIISVGQQDYAVIHDLTTGEVYKTVLYDQALLNLDEDLQLDILPAQDENKAKVIKDNLTKIIFGFKQDNSLGCGNFCVQFFGEKMLVATYLENGIKIMYKAVNSDKKIISKVDIFNVGNLPHKKILSTSFTEDRTNEDSYRLGVYKDVIEKANNYKADLRIEEWEKLIPVYENFLLTFKNTDLTTFKTDLGQSTAFHFSIYKTIDRSLSNNTTCDCLPSPFYFTGKTPFMCLKDVIFNIEESIKVFNENKEEFEKKYSAESIDVLLNYFKNQTEPEVSLEDMYFKLGDTNPDDYGHHIDEIECFGGGQHGCCGNYAGCCWYAHPGCLGHDLICRNCRPRWFCGGDFCVPD